MPEDVKWKPNPHRPMLLAYLGGAIFGLGVGNGKTAPTVLGFLLTLSSTIDLYWQLTQKVDR